MFKECFSVDLYKMILVIIYKKLDQEYSKLAD